MNRIGKICIPVLVLCLISLSCERDTTLSTVDYQSEYIGVWDCNERTGMNAPQFYEITITAGPSDNSIIINNLYHNGTAVNAIISSGFTLDIPDQSSNNISFIGTGSANADFQQITLNFTANDGASGNDDVEAILIK